MSSLKAYLCIILAATIFSSSTFANAGIITTSTVLEQYEAQESRSKVEKMLQADEIKKALFSYGLDQGEIESRLASLTGPEIEQLQKDLKTGQAGGLLVEVLLIIMIVYFAQRI